MAERNSSFTVSADKVGCKFNKSHYARELSAEEIARLEKDTKLVTEFKQEKYEKEAQRNWDIFYKRNTTKFFKDRHWTTREFNELCGKDSGIKLVVLEVGCGVGNFLFPLLEEDKDLFFYACDFSPRAVQFVKDNPLYDETRCKAFQCDLTQDLLSSNVPLDCVDIVSMIFVLSAIHPDKMLHVLENIHTVLKPGGSVLFRDYGLYDHAMLRFAPGHKLSENFYVRQDGTRAYYFSEEKLAELFIKAGFSVASNEYVLRETINRKEGLCVPRVFVQGKFVKSHKNKENSDLGKCHITKSLSNELNMNQAKCGNNISSCNTNKGTVQCTPIETSCGIPGSQGKDGIVESELVINEENAYVDLSIEKAERLVIDQNLSSS